MIKIAIAGAAGRMGTTLAQVIHQTEGMRLVGAIEQPDSSMIGADVGEMAGLGKIDLPISHSIGELLGTIDILIDFSSPDATAFNATNCANKGVKLVVGTTGLSKEHLAAVRSASEQIPICMASNFSTGVNLCLKLAALAAEILGNEVDIEISEAHHRDKVDSPSGTALALGAAVADALKRDLDDVAVYGREGQIGKRPREAIGFSTIRAGDIVGDHSVLFAGDGELVEIKHRASNRMAFATGAVRAAIWLSQKSSGLYDMQDVLGLRHQV